VRRDADGQMIDCLALTLDVSDRRAAREEERQLRQVIELSPAVLWRFDLLRAVPTKLVSSNVSQWGYTPDDFVSGRVLFDDLIHPEDRPQVVQITRDAIDRGDDEVQVEFRFRTAQGTWVWIDERVTVIRDRNRAMLDCISLTMDVTAQREARAAVRERDQFFALSVEIFGVADSSLRFRQVNDAFTRVLGHSAEALVNHSMLEFIVEDDLAAAHAYIRMMAQGQRVEMAELRCRHADGSWRWLEWNAAPGPAGLFYCAARDITVNKRVAADLHRALSDLEQRNAELQDFAFVASHDLQEPLRKVQAFSDRVLNRYADKLDAEGVDYLRRMDGAARRMQSLIDDLLAYSRVSTRGQAFRRVSLDRILREVLADLETRIESSAGEVVAAELPSIEADATQMRQLLQNLVGNALKFSVPGRAPRVVLDCEPCSLLVGSETRPAWRLTVSDNGIGFEQQHAERIFAPFQRLHGRSEYEGTGMGLAIVRKIVERHSGRISASGRPGDGATFTIELPVSTSAAQDVHSAVESEERVPG
jgi:PAS domain S-box-containing protein